MIGKGPHLISETKIFQLETWNQETKDRMMSFWMGRGFIFTETSDNIVGTRGSIWGNLFSFDMSKLIAKLTISVDSSNRCECILEINTILQDITSSNERYWLLELDTFESFTLSGDMKADEWARYKMQSKKADRTWTINYVKPLLYFALISGVIRLTLHLIIKSFR